MTTWKKTDFMYFWIIKSYEERDAWDTDKKKPLRTNLWCDYLYKKYWGEMEAQGLTRNDVFYSIRFPMNRFKKNLKRNLK